MSVIRNLAWLRTEVSRKLDHNSGQPNQAFAGVTNDTNEDIDALIQEAYDSELEEAMQNCTAEIFMEAAELTWPSGQQTFILPDYLEGADILRIDDITNYSPGTPIWVSSRTEHYEPQVFPQDRRTIRWGPNGPGQATTMRITYLPEANQLKDPSDEPRYIPSRYRWLLVWTAAIIGRKIADEGVPGQWLGEQQEWRQKFHIAMSKGRPRGTNRSRAMPVGDAYS